MTSSGLKHPQGAPSSSRLWQQPGERRAEPAELGLQETQQVVLRFPWKGSLKGHGRWSQQRLCLPWRKQGKQLRVREQGEPGSAPAGTGPPHFPGKERARGWVDGRGRTAAASGQRAASPCLGRARQAWNSSLRGTGTGYPEQSQPLRPLCLFHRAPGPGASRRRAGHPSLARAGLPPEQMDRPAAGEPSSRRSRPPQKLPEAPVPTLPVPGRAPGKRNKAWKDLDEDTTL